MEKGDKKLYQKWWFWVLAVFLGAAAINGIMNADQYASKSESDSEPLANQYSNKYDSGTIQGSIESTVKQIVASNIPEVGIDSISVNDNLGTEVEGDFVVLVNLKWDTDKIKELVKTDVAGYCDDISTYAINNHTEIQEITIFWSIPNIMTTTNAAKCTYEQRDGQAYQTSVAGILTDLSTTSSSSSTNSSTSSVVHNLGDSFEVSGYTLIFGADYKFATVQNEFSDYNGRTVVGIPLTETNNTTEPGSFNEFSITVYSHTGIETPLSVGALFDDSKIKAGNLLPGYSQTSYLYFIYDGPGEYQIYLRDTNNLFGPQSMIKATIGS